MEILFFLAGVLITWLVMSGLLAQSCAFFYRFWWPSSRRNKEYKIDQWLCNIPEQPRMGWNLLGYWRETSSYQQACSEMAGLLADKACLSGKDKILDVCFTSHDQLQVWLKYYQVHSLTAIAPDEHQFVRASDQCSKLDGLELLRGGNKALQGLPENMYDKLLALDCVYRFSERDSFIDNSRRVLKDGGVLAFTDMVLSRPFRDNHERNLINALGRISGIRIEDIKEQNEYRVLLTETGFEQVDVADITEDVLSGFCFWFGQHHQNLSLYTRSKLWIRLRLMVWFIRWMQHREQLKYMLIVAR